MLPDSPTVSAQASFLQSLSSDSDLLMEDAFAANIDGNDLRHFKAWHNVDEGVPAQVLKDMSDQHQERMQVTPCNVVIDNDLLPIALAKEAVHWWRLDEIAERDALEKTHGNLLGWDIEHDSILGVPITVQLAEVDHPNVWSPPDLTVNGNMLELLQLVENGDEYQLLALGDLATTLSKAPSSKYQHSRRHARRWKPVAYTKVSSLVPVFEEHKNLNFKVKLVSFGNVSIVGDETGVVCMKVNSRPIFRFLRTLEEGASIIVRKATLRMRNGFGKRGCARGRCIHIDVDDNVGSIELSREPFHFEPDINRNISAQEDDFSARGTIEPGEASCGDVVQVAFNLYSDSRTPIALTLGMRGVIAKFNQYGDAQIAFAGESMQAEWVEKDSLSNFTFAERRYESKIHIDESTLQERDLFRPGWSIDEFDDGEPAAVDDESDDDEFDDDDLDDDE